MSSGEREPDLSSRVSLFVVAIDHNECIAFGLLLTYTSSVRHNIWAEMFVCVSGSVLQTYKSSRWLIFNGKLNVIYCGLLMNSLEFLQAICFVYFSFILKNLVLGKLLRFDWYFRYGVCFWKFETIKIL